MDASPYDIRLARVDDLDLIKASIRRTLNNPEGRSQRKKFADAVGRGELLILVRRERDGAERRFVVSAEADRSGHPPSPGHLRQHMTYGDRVTVRYREGKEGPLAVEVLDAS